MKKILVAIICFILIASLTGCSKTVAQKEAPPETTKPKIYTPIVGTWKYYKNVPEMPSLDNWTLNFKDDGTYTTEGEKIENSTMTQADVWGPKGRYSVQENSPLLNNLSLTWISNGVAKNFHSKFEIQKENGKEELIFKDDSGENTISAFGKEGKYYTIFIKQD